MPAPVGTTPDDASYLRGVRVADVDTGRVVRVLVAVVLIGLIVLAGVLTVSATSQSSRLSKLRDQGVPVRPDRDRMSGDQLGHRYERRILGLSGFVHPRWSPRTTR